MSNEDKKKVPSEKLSELRKARLSLMSAQLDVQSQSTNLDRLVLNIMMELDVDPATNRIDFDTGEVSKLPPQQR